MDVTSTTVTGTGSTGTQVGDLFLSHDGQWITVDDLCDTGEWETVYNFRVADFHTYFVGSYTEWGFTVWAHNEYTVKGRIKAAGLPTSGKIRYVPPKGYSPSMPLPKAAGGGYVDRFGNVWKKGPSRTAGEHFEWDVQLSKNATKGVIWASPDGAHLNVSLRGRVTH